MYLIMFSTLVINYDSYLSFQFFMSFLTTEDIVFILLLLRVSVMIKWFLHTCLYFSVF